MAHLEGLVRLAEAAGRAILAEAKGHVERKADGSPLTAADLASDKVIAEGLAALDASIPVLSEESAQAPASVRKSWTRCFVVDPLDGTKEFVLGSGEYTVNIALVENGRPVAGVVHLPALGQTFVGEIGRGAHRIAHGKRVAIKTKATPDAKADLRVVASRSHAGPETEAFLAHIPNHQRVPAGSSLKFCRVAEGAADLYPRLGPTMEWDTAAGQTVLEAAGGVVLDLHGRPLVYNKPDLHNPFFVAAGSAGLAHNILSISGSAT